MNNFQLQQPAVQVGRHTGQIWPSTAWVWDKPHWKLILGSLPAASDIDGIVVVCCSLTAVVNALRCILNLQWYMSLGGCSAWTYNPGIILHVHWHTSLSLLLTVLLQSPYIWSIFSNLTQSQCFNNEDWCIEVDKRSCDEQKKLNLLSSTQDSDKLDLIDGSNPTRRSERRTCCQHTSWEYGDSDQCQTEHTTSSASFILTS